MGRVDAAEMFRANDDARPVCSADTLIGRNTDPERLHAVQPRLTSFTPHFLTSATSSGLDAELRPEFGTAGL
jgi:hypothetical protein